MHYPQVWQITRAFMTGIEYITFREREKALGQPEGAPARSMFGSTTRKFTSAQRIDPSAGFTCTSQAPKLSHWDASDPEGLSLMSLGSAHTVTSADFSGSVFSLIVTPVP